MSRCFPYPPPGFVRNGVRDEALIESIKRDAEKARKEKKEEKKRRKREKEKAREEGETSEKKHRHKRKHRDGSSQEGDETIGDQYKKQKVDSKNTEKSNLTEEHGQPVSSQNSTDSTLNSCNGLETPPSLAMEGRQRSGSIIRIQLPLQRQKDPDVMPSREQPHSFAPGRTMNNASSTSQMCGTVPRNSWDRAALGKSCSTSSLTGGESSAIGRKISNASMADSQMGRTVHRNIEDKARPEKLSLNSSLKGRESSASGRITSNASKAASLTSRTVPQTSSAGVCSTSSLKGRESSVPGKANSNASLVASQNCSTLPQTGSARVCLSSSIKGQESSAPGKGNSNASLAVSRTVPQTSGARTGQEKSSSLVKSISNGSLAASQVSGTVPRTSGDRTWNHPRTSEDRTGQEQSSMPGRSTGKVSLAASQVGQPADKTGGVRTKPEQPCSTSQAGRDASVLNLGKEEKDPVFSSGAAAETPAQRAEASSAPSSQTAHRPSSSEVKYAKLVENWVPPTLLNVYEEDLDDQEWLSQMKPEDTGGAKEDSKAENAGLAFSHGGSQGPWPRVCFLPEVDIYALPYTVPY